ncbi:MAG TPA: RagB/SusD family nutrient uptake outer membrane protein, partial [Bacteroidales bacterium]|nr:RagB/SusD family nutrient uptake outer membrane protein [Bacteroidales bacterium]
MKTYKIFLSIIAALAIVSFTSCNDYLDVEPEGQLPAEGFFETQEHAIKGVNSIYAHLR